MSTGPAVSINGLGKRYTLGLHQRGYGTLREGLTRRAAPLLRRGRKDAKATEDRELWALHDLSLEIGAGQVVGLIGHNGAGKSTLLKILARITEPSAGYAELQGRVGSLLEVGTGFHPELTGRENIFLNGSILGMRRSEIQRRFDEIVAFSEIERFLDTPVKRYSSGMSVRLAFAVASHLEPEILLVDEVLAVGDAAFQRKSLGKMGQVAREGRTVIFVSHNLAIIQALCERAVLLERGGLVADGPVSATIDHYLRGLEEVSTGEVLGRQDRDARGWQSTVIRRVTISESGGPETEAVVGGRRVRIAVDLTEVLPQLECQLIISNSLGQPVVCFDTELAAPADVRGPTDGGATIMCEVVTFSLLPGRYRIDIVVKGQGHIQDGLIGATFFDVEPGVINGRPMPSAGVEGSVALEHRWHVAA
jgi:lipopolysaccharide transport system ATP-binding protein